MIKYVNISDQKMKDLLYLKDEQIKDCIQLLLYAYRETFSDPKEVLKKNSLGAAHYRTLHLIERNQGISVNELLLKLKINMKLCILGGGLTGLSLAKSLIKKGLSVDIFLSKKNLDFNKSRKIGISNDNLLYFNKEILDIKELL